MGCESAANAIPEGLRRMIRASTVPTVRGVRARPGHRIGSSQIMFGFLTPPTKDDTDPLVSARSVSAWLRHLPTQDVIARQHQVMRIFDGMRQSSRPVDHNRIAAIQFLDTALGADRRQLVKQYVENIDRSARVADRGWQAAQEMSQGFVYAVPDGARARAGRDRESALEAVHSRSFCAPAPLPRHRCQAPRVPARALDPREVDESPPALCPRHRARHCPRRRSRSPAPGPARCNGAPSRNTFTRCMIQQLNMGSLSPAEIDWASAQIRAWGRKLEFEAVPRSSEGLLRRSREQARTRAPHRQRVRTHAAFPRHHAARRPARARAARDPPDRHRRARCRRRGQHATNRDPREGAPGRGAQSPRRSPALTPPAHHDRGEGPRGPRAHLPRARPESHWSSPRTTPTPATRRSRCSRSPTARVPGASTFSTSTIRWRRRSCRSAIRPGRSSDRSVAGLAHHRLRRHRPEPRAGRARRDSSNRRRRMGARRGAPPEQGFERRGRGGRVDHRRPRRAHHRPTRGVPRRKISAWSSTASTFR